MTENFGGGMGLGDLLELDDGENPGDNGEGNGNGNGQALPKLKPGGVKQAGLLVEWSTIKIIDKL